MIKVNGSHHALCEKCEKPFAKPEAVCVTELNYVNATLMDIILCQVQVHNIPGFRSNDWADRLSMWHQDCFPGLATQMNMKVVVTADTVKDMLTNMLDKKDQDKIYRFLHYSLGCRI